MPKQPSPETRLPIRIVVVAPPSDVWFALQPENGVFEQRRRSGEHNDGADLAFELELRIAGALASGAPRLLGAHVKGPPDARFAYIGVGKHAGDASSCWDRRIKVPLGAITHALVGAGGRGRVLEARIAGNGRDGGPACATVALLAPGWSWRAARATPRAASH